MSGIDDDGVPRLHCARIEWHREGRPAPRGDLWPRVLRDPARPVPGRRGPHRRKPVDATVRELLDSSLVTPAGRFFVPTWSSPGRLPLAPPGMFVVHLDAGAGGFLANGRLVPPELLARVIEACPEWRHRPLLLILPPYRADAYPADGRLSPLERALIEQLRVPVYTADTGVWQLAGTAFTGGTFGRWSVAVDDGSVREKPVTVGSFLPRARAHQSVLRHPASPFPADVPDDGPGDRSDRIPAGPADLPVPALDHEPVPLPAPLPLPVPITAGLATVTDPLPETVRRGVPVVTQWSASRSGSTPGAALPASSPGEDPGGLAPVAADGAREQLPPDGAGGADRPAEDGRPGGDRAWDGAPPADDLAARNGVAPPGGDGQPVSAQSRVGLARADVGWRGPEPNAPASGPPWVAVRPHAEPADRERLRALLGWRYEAHSRAVLSTLALQPGLRSETPTVDVLAGLVAARAYLSSAASVTEAPSSSAVATEAGPDQLPAIAEAVDSVLRGAEHGPDRDGLLVLARCVCAGLGRLPAVVGPVLRPALIEPAVLRRYRPGDVLVEPAFVEVSVTPWAAPEHNVHYAIWSMTARRTDRLGPLPPELGGADGRALFAAGTRFVVLDVVPGPHPGAGAEPESKARAEAPAWVLLRETFDGRADDRLDERARNRLRDVVAQPAVWAGETAGGERPRGFGSAIGISGQARAFAVDGGRPAEDLEPITPSRQPTAPRGT